MVNLSVTCNEEVAQLNWSSGGLSVSGIRLAQQCIAHAEHNESTLTSEVIECTVILCSTWRSGRCRRECTRHI